MQRLCVKILLSYFTVLNIFLSALTCTQHAYRLPLNALHFTSLHNRKKRFQLRSIRFWHKICLTDRTKQCQFLQTEDKINHWYR